MFKHNSENDLPIVVFLHGFLGSGDIFKHLIDTCKAYCNPITIDLLDMENLKVQSSTIVFL